jgi:hypothetical protein
MSETEDQLAMAEKIRRLERKVTDLQNLFAACMCRGGSCRAATLWLGVCGAR